MQFVELLHKMAIKYLPGDPNTEQMHDAARLQQSVMMLPEMGVMCCQELRIQLALITAILLISQAECIKTR